jgi:hypothetical protein
LSEAPDRVPYVVSDLRQHGVSFPRKGLL